MARRAGSADLPLHGGRVPKWLADRMTRLGAVIAEAVVLEYGRDAFLARLAHPYWFQSFGAVMGMDWHSSGITTSVLGALKRGLARRAGAGGDRQPHRRAGGGVAPETGRRARRPRPRWSRPRAGGRARAAAVAASRHAGASRRAGAGHCRAAPARQSRRRRRPWPKG